MKKAIITALSSTSYKFMRRSGLFRLVSFDFAIDSDLKLYLSGVSSSPQLYNTYPEIWKFHEDMLHDMFEIVQVLLRGRLSRIRDFMTRFVRDKLLKGVQYDLSKTKFSFRRANRDIFEGKFNIPKNNPWEPLIDMNKRGDAAFFDIIPAQCTKG